MSLTVDRTRAFAKDEGPTFLASFTTALVHPDGHLVEVPSDHLDEYFTLGFRDPSVVEVVPMVHPVSHETITVPVENVAAYRERGFADPPEAVSVPEGVIAEPRASKRGH